MKRDGFILVETITMFLVLIGALTLFYVSANSVLTKQKEIANHDDIVSVYDAYYIKEALNDYSKLSSMKVGLLNNYYGIIVGSDTTNLFTSPAATNYFYSIADSLNLYQIYLVGNMKDLKDCAINEIDNLKCKKTFMTEEMKSYIKTINVGNINSTYHLILEFRKDRSGNACTESDCSVHYTWVTYE